MTDDPIRIGRGRITCRHCGHSIPLEPGDFLAWKKQANDFALFHRHKNEAPQRIAAAEEQNETQENAPHEQDHDNPPQAERQAAG